LSFRISNGPQTVDLAEKKLIGVAFCRGNRFLGNISRFKIAPGILKRTGSDLLFNDP
jgi:hypothetical protein